MDQRGFGFSEGARGYFDSPEQARDDLLGFTERVNVKFGGADVPHFMIGHSLGGAISICMAAERPDLFAGMTLLTPFIQMAPKQKEALDSMKLVAKLLSYFAPTYQLNVSNRPNKDTPRWLEHWRADPMEQTGKACVKSIL